MRTIGNPVCLLLCLIILANLINCGNREIPEQVNLGEIRLLVRGDDIGMSHAVNAACIKAYQEGIMQSVEVMVPCAWFEEAVIMLNENPGLDVGVHLVLNSEWDTFKWRPLTHVPGLVDSAGYFFSTTD